LDSKAAGKNSGLDSKGVGKFLTGILKQQKNCSLDSTAAGKVLA